MKTLKMMIEDDFATGMGIEVVTICSGYAKLRMKVTEKHLNAGGVCHGGAIFTLADLAFAAVANSYHRSTFNIGTQIIPSMFYNHFNGFHTYLLLLLNKRGGGLFKPRLPQNVVISAFLNAFLAVVGDNHYVAAIGVNHVTAFLPHEPKAIFSKQRYNVFN